MQIVIKPDQEKFILEKLQQGKYKSVDDLLTVAFQLLDQHDEREKQKMNGIGWAEVQQ